MLTDNDLNFIFKGVPGIPLVWVINGDCLYDLALSQEHASIFLESDEILDISIEHSDHTGITLRFLKNGLILEEIQTTEYFGSILLSNPQVLNLLDYPNGKKVESPYARFDGEKFIILSEPDPVFTPQENFSNFYPPSYDPTQNTKIDLNELQ